MPLRRRMLACSLALAAPLAGALDPQGHCDARALAIGVNTLETDPCA